MKSNILKCILFLALSTGFLSSCVNSDDYSTPETILTTYDLTPTKTIKEIINGRTSQNTPPVLYTADDIIEGYVTSNDKEGNFYNSISFQTIPTDGSEPIGFSVTANFKAFAKGFIPGRKAYIKLNGLYTAIVDGSLKIGALYQGAIGRISENEWQNYLFPSSTLLDENTFVKSVSLADAASDTKLNTLIEIDNVQFADESLNRTYYDVDSGGGATNQNIVSIDGGTSRFFRVSSFAPFSKKQVASGSGSVRGVMTKYGSTYQFLVRDESDIKLTNPRVVPLFEETFTSNFPNWTKFSVTGAEVWSIDTLYGNPGSCAKMSGYNSGNKNNEDWLISPAIDLSAVTNVSLKFDTATKFSGNALEALISTNYSGTGDPTTATWTTLSATLSPSTGSYAWTGSGLINISAFTGGKVYVAFKYTSTTAAAATWEVDNVKITEN